MAGRPKNSFSNEQVQQIEQYALEGCQTGTIATLMGIAYNTLNRHFRKNMHKKRCERKQSLRAKQNRLADNHPAMAIFLGKNELGQVDKQVIETEATEKVKLDEVHTKEAQRIAHILNLEDAKQGKVG
jgi:hypothetical protein